MSDPLYVICKDYGAEGLRPFAAYANAGALRYAMLLLNATGTETYAVFASELDNPLLVRLQELPSAPASIDSATRGGAQ